MWRLLDSGSVKPYGNGDFSDEYNLKRRPGAGNPAILEVNVRQRDAPPDAVLLWILDSVLEALTAWKPHATRTDDV